MPREISRGKIEKAAELIKKYTSAKEVKYEGNTIYAEQLWPIHDDEIILLRRVMKKLFGKRFWYITVDGAEDKRVRLRIVLMGPEWAIWSLKSRRRERQQR